MKHEKRETFDAVVIGGGLGGLLAAAVVVNEGHSVLVLERLPYVGGRFTTVEAKGVQVTTGALHFAPHGPGGELARILRELGIATSFVERDYPASFYLDGRERPWRRWWEIFGLLNRRAAFDLLIILFQLKFRRSLSAPMNFEEWIHSRTREPVLRRMFERFTHFALSIRPSQISYDEMRAVFGNVARLGMPAIPEGGCKGVIEKIAAHLRERGGVIVTRAEVKELLLDEERGRVNGVRYFDKNRLEETIVGARLVISDIGPEGSGSLLKEEYREALFGGEERVSASGMKVHLLSDVSLIPHKGIMFCLDTESICGLVQLTNSLPALTPEGQHLIVTFQLLSGDGIAKDKESAVRDLGYIFGEKFEKHCRIIGTSAYSGRWPVNHLIQGRDLRNQNPVPGLIMVGDAYKPSGLIMVEGVAGSVGRMAGKIMEELSGSG